MHSLCECRSLFLVGQVSAFHYTLSHTTLEALNMGNEGGGLPGMRQ
jgi:hypothetical protein